MSRGKAAGPIGDKTQRTAQKVDFQVAQGEKATVFDALLFVSLGFLLTGIMFLVLELMKYGFQLNPN